MIRTISIIFLLFTFASCDKKLNQVTVKNKEIQVTKYEISKITTVHDFIEVKRGAQQLT